MPNLNHSIDKISAALAEFRRQLAFAISPEVKDECEHRNIKKAFESGFRTAKRDRDGEPLNVHWQRYQGNQNPKCNKHIDSDPVRY